MKEYVVGEIARFMVTAREPPIGVRKNLVVCVFSSQVDALYCYLYKLHVKYTMKKGECQV